MCKILYYKFKFQDFSSLLGAFYDLASFEPYSWAWFWTISMYIYINYFNSSWIDGEVRLEAKVGIDPQSRPKKPGKTELGVLGVFLPWSVALLRAEHLSG